MFNDKYCLTEAVLQGNKTMTRRDCTLTLSDANTMDEVEIEDIYLKDGIWMFKCRNKEFPLPKENYPKYQLNEIVAISQSYSECTCDIPEQYISKYKDGKMVGYSAGWSNKMFVKSAYMPHNLKIINIKAERLQDISDEDCIKEGVVINQIGYYIKGLRSTKENEAYTSTDEGEFKLFPNPIRAFSTLIDKISGRGTWSRNKWNWAFEFELNK